MTVTTLLSTSKVLPLKLLRRSEVRRDPIRIPIVLRRRRGRKRPYEVAYVASPQHGPKRTCQDADVASPLGLQTTTSSVGAKYPRICEKLHDAVFTNLAALGQGLQVHYNVRGVVRICMPSPVNIVSLGQNC